MRNPCSRMLNIIPQLLTCMPCARHCPNKIVWYFKSFKRSGNKLLFGIPLCLDVLYIDRDIAILVRPPQSLHLPSLTFTLFIYKFKEIRSHTSKKKDGGIRQCRVAFFLVVANLHLVSWSTLINVRKFLQIPLDLYHSILFRLHGNMQTIPKTIFHSIQMNQLERPDACLQHTTHTVRQDCNARLTTLYFGIVEVTYT